MNWELIEQRVDEGYIRKQKHPEFPLYIYNYSEIAQYERKWDEATVNCRGLVADENHNIVARPFPKFFNYGEVPLNLIPEIPALVSTKMDGSLGILYWWDDIPWVATRGSFTSDQAKHASLHIQTTYSDCLWPQNVTPLVEIIYPSNRIVCDYGDRDELILLTAIDHDTGADIPLWEIDWWKGPVVDVHHDIPTLDEAHHFANNEVMDNEEGFVVCWLRKDEPAFRLKIKCSRYVELHRLVTGLSTKSVWQALKDGKQIEMIEGLPDEFHDWFRSVSTDLQLQFDKITMNGRLQYQEILTKMNCTYLMAQRNRRAEFAAHAKRSTYPALMFKLLDGKPVNDMIWDMVKPTFRTYKVDE